ncbi:MAG TPA: DUF1707 domain-containing protein [Streptosporangiaceae bacterium]
MVGPGDETAGRSHLRASHDDRDQVIDLLKVAFAQGRLAKDEFDLRVGKVLASRTYGDLNILSAGIPAGLTGIPAGLTQAQPAEPAPESDDQPARQSDLERKIVRTFAFLLVVVPSTAFGVGLMESQNRPELAFGDRIFLTIVLAWVLTVPAWGLVLFHSWIQKHSCREPPPDGYPTGS